MLLIAPTAMKSTLSAKAVAETLGQCLLSCYPPDRALVLDLCPMADGGDATLEALQCAQPDRWTLHHSVVTGPVAGMTRQACWITDSTRQLVVLEAAQAHGIAHLLQSQTSITKPTGLNAMATTSYGVGELILHAFNWIQAQIQRQSQHAYQNQQQPTEPSAISDSSSDRDNTWTLIVTLGGSASTDGGLGALQALGLTLLDVQNTPLPVPLTTGDLERVARLGEPLPRPLQIDASTAKTSALTAIHVKIATDVTNPLLGPTGTAHTFASQKGATPEECNWLESQLTRVRKLFESHFGRDYAELTGAGAAGGLAYGLSYLSQAKIISGFDWLAEALELPARFQRCVGVITAEGRLDQTSLQGKGVGRLIQWSQEQSKPLLVVCGSVEPGLTLPPGAYALPLSDYVEISRAMTHPREILAQAFGQAADEPGSSLAIWLSAVDRAAAKARMEGGR